MNYLVSGEVLRRNGKAHPNIQPQDVYNCSDGDVILVVGNDGQFSKLCEVLGQTGWIRDERFATNAQRACNSAELSPLLRDLFAKWKRDRLIAALDATGVPCGAINSVADVFKDPRMRAREMLRHVPRPSGVKVPQVASPMRYSRGRPQCGCAAGIRVGTGATAVRAPVRQRGSEGGYARVPRQEALPAFNGR